MRLFWRSGFSEQEEMLLNSCGSGTCMGVKERWPSLQVGLPRSKSQFLYCKGLFLFNLCLEIRSLQVSWHCTR